jgi:hypothetical protein
MVTPAKKEITVDLSEANERLTAIQQLASALKDYIPGDAWHLAHAIEQIADGTKTVAEAMAEVEE